MKFADLDDTGQQIVRDTLEGERSLVRGVFLQAGSETRRYLFIVNTGGAIALLGFMGASEHVRETTTVWIALGLFLIGVLTVGALHAVNFHFVKAAVISYAAAINKYYKGEIDTDELEARVSKARGDRVPLLLSYLSFALFVAGAVVAIAGLMPQT